MAWIPVAVVAAGIAVISLAESTHMPRVRINDKLVHGLMYAALAVTLVVPFLLEQRSRWTIWLSAWCMAVAYGGLMEVLQATCTLTRSAEWADVAANATGALAGIVLVWIGRRLWIRSSSTILR